MGNEHAATGAATTKNIIHNLKEKNLSRNALAIKAGIASATFYRKMGHPEQFTLKDLGSIAEALEVPFIELIKDAA